MPDITIKIYSNWWNRSPIDWIIKKINDDKAVQINIMKDLTKKKKAALEEARKRRQAARRAAGIDWEEDEEERKAADAAVEAEVIAKELDRRNKHSLHKDPARVSTDAEKD